MHLLSVQQSLPPQGPWEAAPFQRNPTIEHCHWLPYRSISPRVLIASWQILKHIRICSQLRGGGWSPVVLFRELHRHIRSMASKIPRVGVAAHVFGPGCQSVLLIQRGTEPCKGMWSVPGGKLDFGETIASAAARETLEETGVKVTAASSAFPVAAVTESLTPENGEMHWHYVLVHVPCTLDEAESVELPLPVASDDAAEAAWVPVESLAFRDNLVPGLVDAMHRCRLAIMNQDRS